MVTSHNTDPQGSDGLKLPATAQEVGLVSERDSSVYDAGDGHAACIVGQVGDREWWCAAHHRNAEICDSRGNHA